jgi:hypothetical protein
MHALLEKANKFAKFADTTFTVVKNSDELLKELSEIEDFKDRVKFAREHWEELGEGSSRTIFRLSESLVLKCAHNKAGIAQCQSEMLPSMQCWCVNRVLVADPTGKWIIVRWTESINEERFEELVGIDFQQFGKAIFYSGNNERHDNIPRNYATIIDHPFYKCLMKLVMNNQLQIGDICKASSFGELDGKVVLRDYGLTKQVFERYYDSDENSTATI